MLDKSPTDGNVRLECARGETGAGENRKEERELLSGRDFTENKIRFAHRRCILESTEGVVLYG